MWTSSALATSALKASFDTGTVTSCPVNSLIAFARLSIKVATSDVPTAFSGSAVVLSATFEAASFAVSKAVFLSWDAVLYVSDFLTFSASATNFCRESILESNSWALVTIASISSLFPASCNKSVNSIFWASFKWDKFLIVSIALSRITFISASSIILSNWSFELAASIFSLYCCLSSSDNPGIWSIFCLYSSFSFSASSWAFWALFWDFCVSASFTIPSTPATVDSASILLLYSSAVGEVKLFLIFSICSFAFDLAFARFVLFASFKILSSKVFVCSKALSAAPSLPSGSVIFWLSTLSRNAFFSSSLRYLSASIAFFTSRFFASIPFSFVAFLEIASFTTAFISSWLVLPFNLFLNTSFSFGER